MTGRLFRYSSASTKCTTYLDLSAKIGHSIMPSLLAKKRQWRISTDNPTMRMRIISNVHRRVIKANGATRIMIVAESTNNIIQEDEDYSSVFQVFNAT